MASGGQRRITKELGECTTNPPTGVKVNLKSTSDIYQWEVQLEGPEGTPYENGLFHLTLTLPTEYPFKPPTLRFTTRIYHMNISSDEKGSMCLGMLRSDQWKPPNKISAVLLMVRELLREPSVEDAVEAGAAQLWREDRGEYVRTAREWVKKYAAR